MFHSSPLLAGNGAAAERGWGFLKPVCHSHKGLCPPLSTCPVALILPGIEQVETQGFLMPSLRGPSWEAGPRMGSLQASRSQIFRAEADANAWTGGWAAVGSLGWAPGSWLQAGEVGTAHTSPESMWATLVYLCAGLSWKVTSGPHPWE